MDLIELMLNKLDERKAKSKYELEEQTRHNQLLMRQRELWESEGASLLGRRIELKIARAEAARQLGISPGRLRRFEEGDRVKERELLKMAYENYLCYMEEFAINIRLHAEIQELRNLLSRNTVIVEVNGKRWSVPLVPTGQRRSVI